MRPPPLREEWDFESFTEKLWDDSHAEPNQRLYDCFAYEFARSLPNVLRVFREDVRFSRRITDGVWRCILVLPSMPVAALDPSWLPNDPSVEVEPWDDLEFFPRLSPLMLVAPEGFPKTPYLKLRPLPQPETPRSQLAESVTPVTENRGIYFSAKGMAYRSDWVTPLHVNWHDSDDAIIKSFRSWVTRSRPVEEISIQGKSIRREIDAHLKALGTWRLLRAFEGDIKKATAYCQRTANKSHFVRSQDWRLSALRAKRILKDLSLREIRG